MAESTGIAWTDHTFNPVWGCTKVSPACDHCYAETVADRFSPGAWGPHGEFRTFGDKHWNDPLRWNRAAEKAATRRRVFCASMADVFDNRWPEGVRERLWGVIVATPWLDWQLLTKRPQNIRAMLPPDWLSGYHNVWLGTTTENRQEYARRWPFLREIPAVVRFLSCEPMLTYVDILGRQGRYETVDGETQWRSGETYQLPDWVICGGESGNGARPMDPRWATGLRDQCRDHGVPFFFKQIGSVHTDWPRTVTGKGDDPAQWPAWLRVQEFPKPELAR